MLKHIPTGQPSSGSRNQHHNHHHHHNDYGSQTISGSLHHQNYGGGTGTSITNSRLPGARVICDASGIYDALVHPSQKTCQPTPSSVHRHPLNHSQLSVNNLSRLNHSHALNFSTLSTSKHSIDSTSPVVGNDIGHLHHANNLSLLHNHHGNHHLNNNNNNNNINNNNSIQMNLGTQQQQQQQQHNERIVQANGGLDISRMSRLPSQTTPSPALAQTSVIAPVVSPPANQHTQVSTITQANNIPTTQLEAPWMSFCLKGNTSSKNPETGVREMLSFLGLLCLVSLLLAMLSHIFLLKISPPNVTQSSFISPEEYTIVYEVTLVLCALALSLNLCCLLVCAIQFLFAMKLVKSSYNQTYRTNMYLQKSSASRMCAVGGFFVSIPIFLTGMILYTFIQFHSTPAIVMSVFIGLGILFCGCAMVHNVFVWQREKTNAMKAHARAQCEAAAQLQLQRQQQIQQNNHQGNLSRGITTIPRGNCIAMKHNNSTLPNHNRGSQHHNHHQQQQHHHHHQLDNSRQAPISPTLLTFSASPAAHNHSSIDVHRIPVSPSTTPAGDHSPTSPVNKSFNRSQHQIQREASGSISPGLPVATLDLSSAATTNSPHELSTLV